MQARVIFLSFVYILLQYSFAFKYGNITAVNVAGLYV